MKIPDTIPVYGDTAYRGPCPLEAAEQVTVIAWIRRAYPKTFGPIAIHVRNEGSRTYGQARWQQAEGMTKGAPDIIIPCSPPILIEIKRRNHTLSTLSDEQIAYLERAQSLGARVGVCLGWEAVKEMVGSICHGCGSM